MASWGRNRKAGWLDDLVVDTRYALKYFARTPLLTLTIVLTLMLGIGTNSAMLAMLDGLTSRPAPGVPADPELVFVSGTLRFGERNSLTNRGISYREVSDYRRLSVFRDVAAWTSGSSVVVATGADEASITTGFVDFVTPNYFDVAGIRLAVGSGFVRRTFGGLDDPELTVILSHSFWTERFGSAPDVVGRRIKINGREVTIVGVAPVRFNGVSRSSWPRKMWMPMSAWPLIEPGSAIKESSYRGTGHLRAMARLAPGATIATSTAAVAVVGANAVAQLPPDRNYRDHRTAVQPIWRDTNTGIRPDELVIVSLVFGSIGILILLVCCTNVSSLLVGAAARRRHEIAVRLSMGAPRRRVIRQLLTEISLLCLAGGTLGLGLYWLIIVKIGHMLRDVDLTPDWSAAGGAIAVALTTAIICGLSPALHATRMDLSSVLKDSASNATTKSRLQRTFVIAQVALTQPLLVGLAMMIVVLSSDMKLRGRSEVGDRLLRVFYTSATPSREMATAREQRRQLKERIAALPGVAGVVSTSNGMMQNNITFDEGPMSGPSAKPVQARYEPIEPAYFKALNVRLTRGREFLADDANAGASETPVIVESDDAVELWGETDPVGKRMRSPATRGKASTYVVVGVVDSRGLLSITTSMEGDYLRFFVPDTRGWMGATVVRTHGPAEPYIATLRSIGLGITPPLVMTQAKTLSQIERDRLRDNLSAAGAAAAGGLLALFLGAIGLYAVVSLGVAQRTKEIGIRVSLGAAPQQVVSMFFGSGLRLAAIGLAIGLPLSLGALWFGSKAVEAPRSDIPLVAGAVMVSVLVVAALASWFPARRAAAVDPITALRAE